MYLYIRDDSLFQCFVTEDNNLHLKGIIEVFFLILTECPRNDSENQVKNSNINVVSYKTFKFKFVATT